MTFYTIDLETCDPNLTTLGTDAHCRRWGSYVFMLQLFNMDTNEASIYHWDATSRAMLRELFDEGHHWVGFNLKYDLNWLLSEEVLLPHHTSNNHFHDAQVYAALLDETQLPSYYSLDGQCRKYGLPTKPKEMLVNAAKASGIVCNEKTVLSHLHRLPFGIVAEYGMHDIIQTAAVYRAQMPELQKARLLECHNGMPMSVVELEDKLLPVLAMMERQGVPVNVLAAEELHSAAYRHIEEVKGKVQIANGGVEVNFNPSKSFTDFILGRGHKLPLTPKSKAERPTYSTAEEVLRELADSDPLIADIMTTRKAEKIAKDFCKGAIIDRHHNGRLHCNYNQIVSPYDEAGKKAKGARSGRLSSSNPNLQQVPKKDSVEYEDIGGLGTAMRRIFIAEEGCQYMSADFAAQEPRWIVHWAETWNRRGAKEVGDEYRKDPTTSSHNIVMKFAKVDKPTAKIINLGKGYEMGIKKLILNLIKAGHDPGRAQEILEEFEARFPHVSASSALAKEVAEKNGYVRTVFGRLANFSLWEAIGNYKLPPLPYEEARERYVLSNTTRYPIRRHKTYRAFNRVVQGSAADQTKYCMVVLWYQHGILPSLQVHDELDDAKIARGDNSTVAIYKEVMENCIKLTVPNLAEVTLGPNWADGEVWSDA